MAEFNRADTAGNIVRRALGTMGLQKPVEAGESPSDKTVSQMWDLLTECGRDMIREYEWQVLTRTHALTTDGQTSYDLPEDWDRYIDATGWNNTGRMPLIGPLSRQQWRMLQARQLGGTTIRLQYVIERGQLVLYFAPSPNQTLNIDYISRGWVQDEGDDTLFRDYVKNDSDRVLFDSSMMVALLKYRWREAKGFEATDARIAYEKALDKAKYADSPKNRLSLNNRSGFPYLGYFNIPDTNYGS